MFACQHCPDLAAKQAPASSTRVNSHHFKTTAFNGFYASSSTITDSSELSTHSGEQLLGAVNVQVTRTHGRPTELVSLSITLLRGLTEDDMPINLAIDNGTRPDTAGRRVYDLLRRHADQSMVPVRSLTIGRDSAENLTLDEIATYVSQLECLRWPRCCGGVVVSPKDDSLTRSCPSDSPKS